MKNVQRWRLAGDQEREAVGTGGIAGGKNSYTEAHSGREKEDGREGGRGGRDGAGRELRSDKHVDAKVKFLASHEVGIRDVALPDRHRQGH